MTLFSSSVFQQHRPNPADQSVFSIFTIPVIRCLIKLKPGSEEKVEKWRSTITSRLDEAAATPKDEDVQVESWFTIEIRKRSSIYCMPKIASEKKVKKRTKSKEGEAPKRLAPTRDVLRELYLRSGNESTLNGSLLASGMRQGSRLVHTIWTP
jgi:Family of unknown function (DUF6176)